MVFQLVLLKLDTCNLNDLLRFIQTKVGRLIGFHLQISQMQFHSPNLTCTNFHPCDFQQISARCVVLAAKSERRRFRRKMYVGNAWNGSISIDISLILYLLSTFRAKMKRHVYKNVRDCFVVFCCLRPLIAICRIWKLYGTNSEESKDHIATYNIEQRNNQSWAYFWFAKNSKRRTLTKTW